MRKLIALILIIGALVLGYLGYHKMQDGRAEIKIGNLEISANDSSSNQESYVLFGLGAVCLIAGLVLSRGKAS